MLVIKLAPVWIFFLLCFLLSAMAGRRNWISRDWRLYWVFAALANAFFQVLIAEVAGAFHSFDRATVAGTWIGLDAALACLMAWKFRGDVMGLELGKGLLKALEGFRDQPLAARLLYGAGLAFALVLGGISLHAPAFLVDSQTYHVPRIMHWLQDKSLRHYACNYVSQVSRAPGAAITSATLYLLDGSDLPINLPSWFAAITSALLASFITEVLLHLVGERNGREWPREKIRLAAAFSFLLMLTVPEGVIQAISTETDLVTGMWNLSLACLTILFLRQPANLFYGAGIGLSLALGICTKQTTFISAAPFLAGAFGLLAWRRFYRRALQLAGILALAGLLLNAPWLLRNYRVFGHPLGQAAESALVVNGAYSPARGLASIFRHASLYTWTPWPTVTKALHDVLYGLVICTGHPVDDPPNIYPTLHFFFPGPETAWFAYFWSNPHAMLLLAALLFVLVSFPLRTAIGFHVAATCLGFCLLCSYLRWFPEFYHVHMPFFVLAMPVIAIGMAAVAHRAVIVALGLVCLGNAMSFLWHSPYYPINAQERFQDKPREEQMFYRLPFLYETYVALAEDIVAGGCTNVLLKTEGEDEVSPLWVCLQDRGFKGAVEDFLVTNETAKLTPTVINGRTALVFFHTVPDLSKVLFGGQSPPFLTVTYADTVYAFGTITALFPSRTTGKATRLLPPDNRTKWPCGIAGAEGVGPNKPALVQVTGKVVTRKGVVLTNNVVRIHLGESFGDASLASGSFTATGPVRVPVVAVGISLLRPVAREDLPLYISDLKTAWGWPKKP